MNYIELDEWFKALKKRDEELFLKINNLINKNKNEITERNNENCSQIQ